MDTCNRLFGIPSSQVREHCILLPVLTPLIARGVGISGLRRGLLYGALSRENRTFIHCGVGSGLAGDALLHLEKTACRDILLFGSCGLVRPLKGLAVASLVTPSSALALESFSALLGGDAAEPRSYTPDPTALQRLCADDQDALAPVPVVCATVASLRLEEQLQPLFAARGIEAVDMECSAVFAAAAHIRRPAAALFFVSDILSGRSFMQAHTCAQRSALAAALRGCSRRIDLFCRPR